MSLIRLNWNPKPRDLRWFGAIFLAGFSLIGAVKLFWPFEWFIARNETLGLWLIGIGVGVGLVGLSGTRIALPLYWLWLGIAFVLGNIMSRVIIALIYFLVMTPMRVLSNIAGRDPLQLKRREVETYWCDISTPDEISRYERQF